MTKLLAIFVVVITITAIYLKPIIFHENQYRVVVVNLSEHKISTAKITGPEGIAHEMKTIRPGQIRDYVFIPASNGSLEYAITQNNQILTGTINNDLRKNETGDIFVVLREMYRVKIHDEFDI